MLREGAWPLCSLWDISSLFVLRWKLTMFSQGYASRCCVLPKDNAHPGMGLTGKYVYGCTTHLASSSRRQHIRATDCIISLKLSMRDLRRVDEH